MLILDDLLEQLLIRQNGALMQRAVQSQRRFKSSAARAESSLSEQRAAGSLVGSTLAARVSDLIVDDLSSCALDLVLIFQDRQQRRLVLDRFAKHGLDLSLVLQNRLEVRLVGQHLTRGKAVAGSSRRR